VAKRESEQLKYRPVPTPAPSQQYLDAELRRLQLATELAQAVTLTQLNAAPDKITDGQIIYADGTNFNPGDGENIYARLNGAWQSLGGGLNGDANETISGNWTFTGDIQAPTIFDTSGTDWVIKFERSGSNTGGFYHDLTSQYWLNSSGNTLIQNEYGSQEMIVPGAFEFSGTTPLIFNVPNTSTDPDIRFEINDTLTALIRWDSSENKLNFQDRQTTGENIFTIDLDAGFVRVGQHSSVGTMVELGQDNTGTSGAVGTTQHTDSASLSYRAYLAYDCFWDDSLDQWTAIRPTLGRKSALTLGYHDAGLQYKYYDSASSSFTDANFQTEFYIDSVNNVEAHFYNDIKFYDGGSTLAYHFDHSADVLKILQGRRTRIYNSTNAYYTDAWVTSNSKSPNSLHYLGDSSQGGSFRVQAVALADDATATFSVGSYYIAFVLNTYNRTAFAHFGGTTTQAPQDFGSGSLVSFGTSNPNIDGRVNIWPSASGEFSIKNRLGSSRSFYIFTLEL